MALTAAQRVAKAENILDDMLTELETEADYRATNGPKATYSLGGKSVNWDNYFAGMQKAILDQKKLIAIMAGPWRIVSRART